MNQQRIFERLKDIVKDQIPTIEQNLIFRDEAGYSVFGKYYIRKQEHVFVVTKNLSPAGTFGSLQTAISWCIADKYGQRYLANEILQLDTQHIVEQQDYTARYKIWQKMKEPQREQLRFKIEDRQARLTAIKQRLSECIDRAKYWQTKGFNNETSRTGRSSPNRTSR